MSDLIERQKTIDALELTTWYHQNRNGEMVKGANNKEDQAWYKAEDVYKVLKDAPSVQPEVLACGSGELNVQPEPQWIPVTERLPEDGGYYIVTENISEDGDKWVGLRWYSTVNGWEFEPVAWMPLPKPYRAERRTDGSD